MNALSKNDLVKATQLTRAGRLKEAMALLRGALSPAAARPAASPRPAGAVPTPGGRFETRSFANVAGARTYKLFIPSAHRKNGIGLIVMLHGCAQNPDDFAAGTGMNNLAEEAGFLVAYPAQSQSANAQKCWNWFSPADQRRGAGEPGIIAGIASEIATEFGIKPGQIFAAGLSAGGALAAILGHTYPDLFAAIGVHSGLACGAATDMASAFTAMRNGGNVRTESPAKIPTIIFHGDKDRTVSPVNADQVFAHAQSTGEISTMQGQTNGMAYTTTIQTGPDGKPITEKWILHGAGHAWSGGSKTGSFTNQAGPDASREMVRFFGAVGRK